MELIDSLAKQASQITMYDVKSYYTQAKNAILNVSEMEAKVKEATNDDPWGASSTLMQQIADGRSSHFNEIMPTIYSRFMEKEAREWRQIYKALTLLEFLVKNGSERVVDDARAHVSTIKMLRSFHYIDDKGKDQGINGKNRASEIALLLSDVEKIRAERRKARANKNKYQGVGNDGSNFATAVGGRYGGFGSDSLGDGSPRFGGDSGEYEANDYRSSLRSFRDTSSQQPQYEEYEGADDFDEPPRRTTSISHKTSSRTGATVPPKTVSKDKKVGNVKEVNLFDFDDEPVSSLAPAITNAAPVAADDDFDDFQSAVSGPSAVPSAALAAPKPTSNNVFDLLNSTAPLAPSTTLQQATLATNPVASPPISTTSAPNYGGFTTSFSSSATPSLATANNSRSHLSSQSSTTTPAALSPKPTGGNATFDDLLASSLSSIGKPMAQQKPLSGKTIKDLEKEKINNTLWGSVPLPSAGPGNSRDKAPSQPQAPAKPGGDFGDLLL
nr:ENTH domain-containing protein c [Cryptococcus depauperatus CBS 7855]